MKRAAALAILFAVSAQAQSLADLARQEKARRAGVQSSVTITNDSLGAAPKAEQPPAAPASQPPQEKAATASKSATPADRQVHDEKYWRTAFGQAREELSRAENEAKVLELRLNEANTNYLLRSDIFNKDQKFAADINSTKTELDAARTRVEDAKEKISQLEEALRRSGAPAGWAR